MLSVISTLQNIGLKIIIYLRICFSYVEKEKLTLNNVNVYIFGLDIELFSFLGKLCLKYCYRMNFAEAGVMLEHVRHLTLYLAAKTCRLTFIVSLEFVYA